MPKVYSAFKQSIYNVSVIVATTHDQNLLQNDNCHINELVKQIILYRPQNGLLARIPRNDVGQLWHVSLIVFQHSIPHMITHWHID